MEPRLGRDISARFQITRDRASVWNDDSQETFIPCEPCFCTCKSGRRDMEPRLGRDIHAMTRTVTETTISPSDLPQVRFRS
jgi:hypothetical protein